MSNSLFEAATTLGHEQLTVWHDPAAGLRVLIASHSTRLDPAVGDIRFWQYETIVKTKPGLATL